MTIARVVPPLAAGGWAGDGCELHQRWKPKRMTPSGGGPDGVVALKMPEARLAASRIVLFGLRLLPRLFDEV
jgi:hypothetical protein